MSLIERYLFRQLLGPTLWAIAALGALGIVSQSLTYLDLIVEQRQSAWLFIKVIALAMPMTVSPVITVAILVAGLIALNRLQTDHEIVVCHAGGISRWRVLSPLLQLAGWATLFALVVNLWVAPWSNRQMAAEITAARADLAAALVREGQFTQPVQGLTVYAQEVGAGGVMRNIFIDQDDLQGGKSMTYTARSGRLIKQNGRPMLMMQQGASQQLTKDGVLNYLEFTNYPFDLGPYLNATTKPKPKAGERYMRELLHPAADDAWAQTNRGRLIAEAWSRVANPLYCLAFMALAATGVLGGNYSRMGYGRRIAVVSLIAMASRVAGLVVVGACAKSPELNPVQVILPLVVFAGAIAAYVGRPLSRPARLAPTVGAPA